MSDQRVGERGPSRTARRAIALGVGVGTLVLVAVLSGRIGPWGWRPPEPRTLPTPSIDWTPTYGPPKTLPPIKPPAPAQSGGVPPWVWVLLGALVVALLAALLWSMRRRPAAAPAPPPAEPAVPSGPEPADGFDRRAAASAIIASWESVEQAAGATGRGRLPQQTPTEFLSALLATVPADAGRARTLLALYHRARFDRVALEPDNADAAASAAAHLRQAVQQSAGGPG